MKLEDHRIRLRVRSLAYGGTDVWLECVCGWKQYIGTEELLSDVYAIAVDHRNEVAA